MTNFGESFNILFFSFRFEYRTRNLQGTKRYKQTKAKTRHRNRADREARGVGLWKLCGPCGNSFRELVDFRKIRFRDSRFSESKRGIVTNEKEMASQIGGIFTNV